MSYGYIPLENKCRAEYETAYLAGDTESADRLASLISWLKDTTELERLEYALGEPCAGWSCDE